MTKEFIAILEDMVKEYELLSKYNGGKDYLRWNVLQACIDEAKDHEEKDHEEKGLMAIMGDDGIFREYKDEFDITIHCESQEEQDQVKEILNQEYISKEDLNKIIAEMHSRLDGVNITLDVLVENDALIPRMEGAKTTLEECLSIIAKYTQKEAADDTEQAEE